MHMSRNTNYIVPMYAEMCLIQTSSETVNLPKTLMFEKNDQTFTKKNIDAHICNNNMSILHP